jgi:hypothetical protein
MYKIIVAVFIRNGWQLSAGTGGRFGPEYTQKMIKGADLKIF